MAPEGGGSTDVAVRRLMKRCPECGQQYTADSMFCPFDGAGLADAVWVAPTDPSVDPLLGTLIDGRYRVERVLGEGGTGTVYEVTHETLRRAFAAKVLRRDIARDPAVAGRFLQEARATASLGHPHIVSISDFGRLPDQTPYFIMERLTGRTLAQVCRSRGALPLDRAVKIVLQVADALGAAHEAGIVHRDLKPENLFLVGATDLPEADAPEPTLDDVRVVDFGAAKIAGGTRITKPGIVFGTPHYMSPEQASGQSVDHRADIYALGVIMYELFTGRLPFEADTLMGVLTKHMYVDPPSFAQASARRGLSELSASVLERLEGVTRQAMAKRPERRIQTMAALAADLARTASFDREAATSTAPGSAKAQRPVVAPAGVRADRADRAPSGDLPVLAGLPSPTSWRGGAIGLGVVGVAATVAAVATGLALRHPGAGEAATPTAAQASASSAPGVARPAVVHLTTVPPFAEVWRDGRRIGTAPIDLPIDPTGAPTQCSLRAPGYAERPLVVDPSSPATLEVALDQAAPASSSRPTRSIPATAVPPHARPPQSSRPRRTADGELVDPFAR